MRLIHGLREFRDYWRVEQEGDFSLLDPGVDERVIKIIEDVWLNGEEALKRYTAQFDGLVPSSWQVSAGELQDALARLQQEEPDLFESLSFAAAQIRAFAEYQRSQFQNFEVPLGEGLMAGQRVIPVRRVAVYVPAGRFPLVSTVLMGVIPAVVAGVPEIFVVSPPRKDGLPDRRILAAAALAGAQGVYAMGGAQAIAALARGTEHIPRVDLIVGPGNKYVAAAKRLLYGRVGIDFVAGPTDVLIIWDGTEEAGAKRGGGPAATPPEPLRQGEPFKGGNPLSISLIVADLLAQAEHDPDARARLLVPSQKLAEEISQELEEQVQTLPTADIARASLQKGGLMVIYSSKEEAQEIANLIAPEHLELHVSDPESWIEGLYNYGSLFIGPMTAEVLGDYSAGINHTLPTGGTARFTGGLSVRHFLKTQTTLRCTEGKAVSRAYEAAERIARAEGLEAHRRSAALRIKGE